MGLRGDVDDAGGRARLEDVEEQLGEQEVPDVVRREGGLHAVLRRPSLAQDRARVVDQHVEPIMARPVLGRELAHRRLRREIAAHEVDVAVAGGLRDLGDRGLALLRIASHRDHRRAHLGELERRDLADAGGGAGDHANLAVHARIRDGSPRTRQARKALRAWYAAGWGL